MMDGENPATNWSEGYNEGAVAITDLGPEVAEGTAEKVAEVEAALKDGSLHVFDTSKFTVNGETVTTAPIDLTFYDYSTGTPVAVYQGDTEEAITDGYFSESTLRLSLIHILRESGVMNGAITTEFDPETEPEKLAALMPIIKAYAVTGAVDAVTLSLIHIYTEFSYLPADVVDCTKTAGENVVEFNRRIIEATKASAGCYKVQIAYYESLGLDGMRAYAETLKMVRATGLPVIADIKRGDIAKTAEMYAKAHFTGDFEADIITLAPYMGLDLSLIHI